MNLQLGRDLLVAASASGLTDDLCPQDHLLRRCSSSNPTFQLLSLLNC
jgi:hypothetical protein